ncbi:MAG TPA: L,D-transpeptidase family protein [Ohtaekwangia sp.]|uniref:L,D-transpeptidase family protein n=1 Tax=Ohtaekwangia sp. TaxID=2066019 RepID=UPI002F9593CD
MKFVFAMTFILLQTGAFKEHQQKFDRVKQAYTEKEEVVRGYFRQRRVKFEGFHLFIRAFKKEQKLEAWVCEKGKDEYTLLAIYNFCSSSGVLGPKRKEGDLQIPEGIYQINHFNPQSNFHLSLGINYPNASDKILSDQRHPGGAIYIHGNCVTVGCIPITDDKIKELYILAVEARNNGQTSIPVHIFPSALDPTSFSTLQTEYKNTPALLTFWKGLEPIYTDFEKTKKLRAVHVNKKGEYHF